MEKKLFDDHGNNARWSWQSHRTTSGLFRLQITGEIDNELSKRCVLFLARLPAESIKVECDLAIESGSGPTARMLLVR